MIDDTFKKSFKSWLRLARSDVPRPVLSSHLILILHVLPRPDSLALLSYLW